MDQHEKDWIRLGQDLRDYQPPGDPSADFAAFQELQRAQASAPRRTILAWALLGALLALFGWFLLLPANLTQDLQETRSSTSTIVETQGLEGKPQPLQEDFNENEGAVTESQLPAITPEVTEGPAVQPSSGLIHAFSATTTTTTTTTEVIFPEPEFTEKALVRKVTDSSQGALIAQLSPVPVELSSGEDLPEVTINGVLSLTDIRQQASLPRITFGGGLSTHWRGDRFMSDIDHGVYVSMGLQQPLGQRFLLDGRVGYRGHNLNLKVFEDDKPWSHYEEKINEIDASGEEIEYTYLGIVDGYKGIEFSLLVQYQLNRRTILQAGGRYSLPSLTFRRTVHSSRDGDVTAEPSPYQFLANEQPLVKYYDYGAVFGGQYQINNTLSFEAQLHFGMVDLIEDDGERMNRFNHSSSLSLGLRYRLN